MLEGAIVLPLTILTMITVILILLFFYSQSVETSRMHVSLRCAAGQLSERTVYYAEDGTRAYPESYWNGSIETKKQIPFMTVCGTKYISMLHKGILYYNKQNMLAGSCYVVDTIALRRNVKQLKALQ